MIHFCQQVIENVTPKLIGHYSIYCNEEATQDVYYKDLHVLLCDTHAVAMLKAVPATQSKPYKKGGEK